MGCKGYGLGDRMVRRIISLLDDEEQLANMNAGTSMSTF
jgi:hypothetical protein